MTADYVADLSARVEQQRQEHVDALAKVLLVANPGVWFEVGLPQFKPNRDGDNYTMTVNWPIRWFRDDVEIDPADLAWPL